MPADQSSLGPLQQSLQLLLETSAQMVIDRAVVLALQLAPYLVDAGALWRELKDPMHRPNLHQIISPSS